MRRILCLIALLSLLVTGARAQNNTIAQRPWGQQTVTFSATPTFDASKSLAFVITLTGNVTSSTLTGAEPGMILSFEVCQDGTGGRTFTWPAQLLGTTAPSTAANQCTLEVFNYDGTNGSNPAGIPLAKLVLSGTAFTNTISGTFTANRTTTIPDNSGTLAELNLAQTFTANQSLSNGTELHFMSNNGTNFFGFKGGASTVNLVYTAPTTDSSGTQCLSSNGSLQLSWSACSAGTGTPGGANTQVQFNNSGSFGGSTMLTWVSPKLTIGLAGTATGQLGMTGATSGTVTIQAQATAGTVTLTLPNTTGTVANGATAPITLDAVAGTIACATCVTSVASLTNNQIVLGAGGQGTQTLGSLGTTTTVLHGNASGIPSFGAVSLTTDVSGTLPIGSGGTNATTASTAFANLAPTTTRGDLIVFGASGNTRLALGANGSCVVSNGTDALWGSCAAGAVGGSGTATQGAFFNTSSTITSSPNWTYFSTSGHVLVQGSNNVDVVFASRQTDTAPTGNFLHFQNAAKNADLYKVDVGGNVTATSLASNGTCTGGGTAGCLILTQGTAPSLTTNHSVTISVPAVVTDYVVLMPQSSSTGFLRGTNVANVNTMTFSAASGIGACVNTVVTATNDNTPPTCSPVIGAMFGSQGQNLAFLSPNGSSGTPTFRAIVSADIPAANLNLGGNGGVTGTLPIANGGTNAVTASNAFNNLSPMTTAGDIIYGGTAGAGTRLGVGTATQVLHSGTTPSWSAVSLTADVTGTLPMNNGGTNSTGASFSTNGGVYFDGTKLVSSPTGGAGTLCFVSTGGGTPVWGSCAGSAGASWSALTNPTGNLSLSMGANTTTFTWGAATGASVNPFTVTDTASNTGTGDLVLIKTASSSALNPLRVTAGGTANGVEMSTAGVLAAIGTGGITATATTLNISTSSPLSGGASPFNTNITLSCSTCVTSASALTNLKLVAGSGGGQGVASADLSGDVTTSGGLATTIAANAVTSAKTAVVNTRRTCSIDIGGEDSSAALTNTNLGPLRKLCQIPFAATVVEVDVAADQGTPNVIMAKRHCTASPCGTGANETVSNLVSAALATASAGATACSNTGGTTGFDGFTTCTNTLQNTSLSAGDWLELVSGTAGGAALAVHVIIHYTVN
jgi:hypothetical protein